MIDISIEEVLKVVENKYKAVVIAAQEARRLNVIKPKRDGEGNEEVEEKKDNLKPVEEALLRFITGKVDFEESEVEK
jgi:DNA-directed RNA polymerase omega subunit